MELGKLFYCDADSLTSVYSWGDIKSVLVFHYKVKTKLTLFHLHASICQGKISI